MSTVTIPPYAQELLAKQAALDKRLEECVKIFAKAERGAMGLTLEAVKTPEWISAKTLYSSYWNSYRKINQKLNKIRKATGFQIVEGKRVTIYEYK